jgi:hypothetical protein
MLSADFVDGMKFRLAGDSVFGASAYRAEKS